MGSWQPARGLRSWYRSADGAVREPGFKRPLDFTLAVLGLVVSLPLWILIAAAIMMDDRRPVFYRQERLGRDGRRFWAWKFRSMIRDAEALTGPAAAARNDPRVTRVGRVLRSTALDELPQVLNILKGEMSFVGPRADRPWEIEDADGDLLAKLSVPSSAAAPDFLSLIPNYQLRLLVRPGLTGLAQVFARYDTPRRQRLRFDLLYLRRMNLWLDMQLITRSLWNSLRGRWDSWR